MIRCVRWVRGVLLLAVLQSAALGFGNEGHEIVAKIAERRLSKEAKASLEQLLAEVRKDDTTISEDETSFERMATWADEIRRKTPHTAPWHFVDVPNDKETYDEKRDAENGCIVTALVKFESVLADKSRSAAERFEALRFLIHFVGDLHQPLHCDERDNDRGGNDVHVKLPGSKSKKGTNLHSVWDTYLVKRVIGDASPEDAAEELDSETIAQDSKAWKKGTFEKWANESHQLAQTEAYQEEVPEKGEPSKTLSEEYLDNGEKIVRVQLRKAGVRLATVLNRVLTK
jgi:hypothetical protein